MNRNYKLGEFAKLAGVSPKSLQRWDKSGILVADRTDGYHRSYTDDHLKQLDLLRKENANSLNRKKHYKYKDLTGLRFGKLLVLRRTSDWIGSNGHRHIQWDCLCDCGAEIVVKGSSLNAGYNKSCGCSQYGNGETKRMWDIVNEIGENEAQLMISDMPARKPNTPTVSKPHTNKPRGVLIDLTGQSFGLWSVKKRGETRYYAGGGQAVCWVCECDCGTIKTVPGRDLKSGASSSCGCLSSMSKLEFYVKKYLGNNFYTFNYQKTYPDLYGTGGKLLSYDFVVYAGDGSILCVIECQGEQHYRPVKKFGGAKQFIRQQIHDKLKYDYAASVLQTDLYEVPYTCISELDVFSLLKNFGL